MDTTTDCNISATCNSTCNLATSDSENSRAQKRKRGKKKQNKTNSNKASKKRPNYFIGIKISRPLILGKILALQNFISSLDNRYKRSIVPVSTTHITLAVLCLEDEANISRVVEILESVRDEILDVLESDYLEIHLQNLGNFNNEVLFVNILPGTHLEKLTKISKLLEECCAEYCTGGKAFKPHVTVLKLSKLYGPQKKRVRKIPPYLYNELSNHSFGTEKGTSMQLLSMLKKKQANGYYHSEYTFHFDSKHERNGSDSWSLSDWSECNAVACISSALYLSNPNALDRFSSFVAKQAVEDGIKIFKKTPSLLLKRSKKNDKMRTKLANLKKVLAQEETKQSIREELGVG